MSAKHVEIAWPRFRGKRIFPVFLPFMGCRGKCVFCSQSVQTGVRLNGTPLEIDGMLEQLEKGLLQWLQDGAAPEIAFYGGTFTALPEWAWKKCIAWLQKMQKRGVAAGMRCSTRPDALSPSRLQILIDSGCHLVELGVQSFSNGALARSGRNYGRDDIYEGLAELDRVGLDFGIQLLPGMPGVSYRIFLQDVKIALGFKPTCLRYYPCLVLADTRLEAMWRAREYQPWALAQTIKVLGHAWAQAQKMGIPVIRMGLAPQSGLESAILAGPFHAALGSRVMGYGLLLTVRQWLRQASMPASKLWLPGFAQGYLWGWRNEYYREWEKMGLTAKKVEFWDREAIRVDFADSAERG